MTATTGVFSCEDQFKICKAAADGWLDRALAQNPNLAQKAIIETEYIAMVIACQTAEARCITLRKIQGSIPYLKPILEPIVYVIGMIIMIAGIAYIVASIAPLVLVPILAL